MNLCINAEPTSHLLALNENQSLVDQWGFSHDILVFMAQVIHSYSISNWFNSLLYSQSYGANQILRLFNNLVLTGMGIDHYNVKKLKLFFLLLLPFLLFTDWTATGFALLLKKSAQELFGPNKLKLAEWLPMWKALVLEKSVYV